MAGPTGLLFAPGLTTWGALHVGLGLPGMANAALSITALHPVEIELGVEGSLGHQGLLARAGPALHIVDRRDPDTGRGLTAHAPLFLGYRRMDFGRGTPAHALTLGPAVSLDLWAARHLALDLQLSAGASITLSDPSGGIGAAVLPDVSLRVGVAL